MIRCASCGAMAQASIDLTLTVRPVWDWTREQTEQHEIGLCGDCLARLSTIGHISAAELVEFAP